MGGWIQNPKCVFSQVFLSYSNDAVKDLTISTNNSTFIMFTLRGFLSAMSFPIYDVTTSNKGAEIKH